MVVRVNRTLAIESREQLDGPHPSRRCDAEAQPGVSSPFLCSAHCECGSKDWEGPTVFGTVRGLFAGNDVLQRGGTQFCACETRRSLPQCARKGPLACQSFLKHFPLQTSDIGLSVLPALVASRALEASSTIRPQTAHTHQRLAPRPTA